MNIRKIAVNANSGAFVNVLATLVTSRLEFMEDEATATQGLQFYSPVDAFANLYTVSFASEPVQIPNFATWDHFRKVLGMLVQWTVGAFNYRAADQLLSVRSNTGTATTLRFLEYE